jgi:hypothetical protein
VAHRLDCRPVDVRLITVRLLAVVVAVPVPCCPPLLGRVPGVEPLLSTLMGSSVEDSCGVYHELTVACESVGEGWLILYGAGTGW